MSVRALPWLCCLGKWGEAARPGPGPARKTRGVSWWKGTSLPLPSWTSELLGLALPQARWAEVRLCVSVTNPWGGWGCPRLHLASYQLPSLTKS